MIIFRVSPTTTIGWRVDPIITLSPTTCKPLGFYANLSVNIDTNELTQKELGELINLLILVLDGHKDTAISTNWIEQHWKILLEDPAGVIKWAANSLQSLTDASQGGTT